MGMHFDFLFLGLFLLFGQLAASYTFLYEDFSNSTVNESKWQIQSPRFAGTPFNQYYIDSIEQMFHTQRDTLNGDRSDVSSTLIGYTFRPGDILEYEVILRQGYGNYVSSPILNGQILTNILASSGCVHCAMIGYWSGPTDCGNIPGLYKVTMNFISSGVRVDITSPDTHNSSYNVPLTYPIIVGFSSFADFDGVTHFDYDNFFISSPWIIQPSPSPSPSPSASPTPIPFYLENLTVHAVTSDSAFVTWDTNLPAMYSLIKYRYFGDWNTQVRMDNATQHYFTLASLASNATYSLVATSCFDDYLCNESASEFTTLPVTPSPSPTVDPQELLLRISILEEKVGQLENQTNQLVETDAQQNSRLSILEQAVAALQQGVANLQSNLNSFLVRENTINNHLNFLPKTTRTDMVCSYMAANNLRTETAFGLTCTYAPKVLCTCNEVLPRAANALVESPE